MHLININLRNIFSAYYVPNILKTDLQILPHLSQVISEVSKCYYNHQHFTNEEIEAQKGKETWLSPVQQMRFQEVSFGICAPGQYAILSTWKQWEVYKSIDAN